LHQVGTSSLLVYVYRDTHGLLEMPSLEVRTADFLGQILINF